MAKCNPKESTTLRLDEMLRAMRDAPIMEPSAGIRQNLLRMIATSRERAAVDRRRPAQPYWVRWAVLSAVCGAVLVGAVLHSVRRLHNPTAPNAISVAHVDHLEAPHEIGRDLRERTLSPRRVILVNPKRVSPRTPPKVLSEPASFNIELPYSNRVIANGTNTTISVAVSRDELVALGFPLGDTTGGGKFLAEIALGDDGLPRSIRVPLPLRSLN